MSAQEAVQAALIATIEAHSTLSGAINGVFVGKAVRATAPYVVLGESIAADWGSKSARGREIRIAVTVIDAAESPARLHRLMADLEDAIEDMARDLPGWRVASLVFLRSRILRDAARDWAGMVEYRVRVMAV